MEFKNCSIVIPVIRETDLFEHLVEKILDVCSPSDLAEFIIVVSRERTAKESFSSIEKMKALSEGREVPYRVVEQKLPYMGGAMRDGIAAAKGSHLVIHNADMATGPELMPQLIAAAKENPCVITSVSRYVEGGSIGSGYKKFKRAWNVLSQKYCAFLFHSRVTDYTYMYRICPTAYYHAVNWQEKKHPFALETTLKFIRLGLEFQEIPGVYKGYSQSGFFETMLYLPMSIRVRLMRKKKMLNCSPEEFNALSS